MCRLRLRGYWTPCRPSSTRWPSTAGRVSTWTWARAGDGRRPGSRPPPQWPTRRGTTPWWARPCSTRVTCRRPRKTWTATGSCSPTPSASSQKVIGLAAPPITRRCMRAGDEGRVDCLFLFDGRNARFHLCSTLHTVIKYLFLPVLLLPPAGDHENKAWSISNILYTVIVCFSLCPLGLKYIFCDSPHR